MKNTWIIVLVITLSLPAQESCSQELSHQVLVPAAGIVTGSSLEYTHTVGESFTETAGTPDFVITQGFQQPRMIIASIIPPSGTGVSVYPNPADEFINVELFGTGSRSFTIQIINIRGAVVISDNIEFTDNYWQVRNYPASRLGRGLYFVRIMSSDRMINRTFKIEKL